MTFLYQQNKRILLSIIVGIILIFVFFLISREFLLKSANEDRILIVRTDNDSKSDLFLTHLNNNGEKPISLATNVFLANVIFSYVTPNGQILSLPNSYGDFGKFIPGSDLLLYWFLKDNKVFVNSINTKSNDSRRMFDSKDSFLEARYFIESGKLFVKEKITEVSDEKIFASRCSIMLSNSTKKIAIKGLDCFIADDGSKVLTEQIFSSDTSYGTEAILVDANGKNETPFLHAYDLVGLSGAYSYDLSRLTYIDQKDNREKLILINTDNGDVIAESSWFSRIIRSDFAKRSNVLFFIAENLNGKLELYTMDEKGEEKIDSGLTMTAQFDSTGSYLIYMLESETNERYLYTYSMADHHDIQIANGISLDYILLDDRIIFKQIDDSDLIISSVKVGGNDVKELYVGDDDDVVDIYHVPNSNLLFIIINNYQGKTLIVTPFDQETGFELLDDWVSISLLNVSRNNKDLLFAGRELENDDFALYSIPLIRKSLPIKLDDEFDEVKNAVINPKGDKVIYSISYNKGQRDSEIRQVDRTGNKQFEVLFDDAVLYDVQWTELNPFKPLTWEELLTGVYFCSNMTVLTLEMEVKWEGIENLCFQLGLNKENVYVISVENPFEVYLSLYDNQLNLISDLDIPKKNPKMVIIPKNSGPYFIRVSSSISSPQGDFSINLEKGLEESAFNNPTILTPGMYPHLGHISSSDKIEISSMGYSGYGNIYAFNGKKGDVITLDVHGNSIGSTIDPLVLIFSETLELLGSDDDSGDGSDSRLTLTLPNDGWYFALIRDVNNNFGSEYFYEILLSVEG